MTLRDGIVSFALSVRSLEPLQMFVERLFNDFTYRFVDESSFGTQTPGDCSRDFRLQELWFFLYYGVLIRHIAYGGKYDFMTS
jgi:hypothetical protein